MTRNVSVLIPAYNEQDSVKELYSQIVESISDMQTKSQVSDYEIWFVNDGSTDKTEDMIRDIIETDSKVHLISFRKNFGKSPALQAGFKHVKGDIIFTLDADLQDDPAEFSRFVEKIDEGYDMVVGWKYNRLDPLEKNCRLNCLMPSHQQIPALNFMILTADLNVSRERWQSHWICMVSCIVTFPCLHTERDLRSLR